MKFPAEYAVKIGGVAESASFRDPGDGNFRVAEQIRRETDPVPEEESGEALAGLLFDQMGGPARTQMQMSGEFLQGEPAGASAPDETADHIGA